MYTWNSIKEKEVKETRGKRTGEESSDLGGGTARLEAASVAQMQENIPNTQLWDMLRKHITYGTTLIRKILPETTESLGFKNKLHF